MRVAKGRLNWGVFFIVLGLIPLAYHQGAITQSQIADSWRLWPLIIVGIGVGFLLSRTPAYFVGGLVVAATLGLIFGSLFAIGPNLGCGNGSGSGANVTRSGTFDGSSTVQLNLQCGSATISTSNDGQWHVDANNDGGRYADVTSTSGSLTVKAAKSGGDWFRPGTDTWRIALPTGSEINLNATMDLGEANYTLEGANLDTASFKMSLGSLKLDLNGAHLNHLTIDTSLGSAAVELDASNDISGDLKTSLGSLKLCAPSDLGLQIKSSSSLSSESFAGMGMHLSNGVWETSNYQTAAHKATFTADTSLGSLELHPAGGCK